MCVQGSYNFGTITHPSTLDAHCLQSTTMICSTSKITIYKQFGWHDCGLFTLKAIEHWDGERLPEFIGASELNLRKQMLFEWLNSKENKANWREILLKKSNQQGKKWNAAGGNRKVVEGKGKRIVAETILT